MNPKSRSLAATVLLVVAVVVLLRDHALIARTPIGIALQGLAIALMLWARLTFGMRSFHATANPTEGGLVTAGPYRYWRHPIYAAVLLVRMERRARTRRHARTDGPRARRLRHADDGRAHSGGGAAAARVHAGVCRVRRAHEATHPIRLLTTRSIA